MAEPRRYDAVIIGAGQAGVPLAKAFAQAGQRTALIEREYVGGTCINVGCTPSKTMAASARVAYLAKRASDYGVVTGSVSLDMEAVRRRTQALVKSWRDGSRQRLESLVNLDLIMGEARFLDAHTVEIRTDGADTLAVRADRVFINTGCRPAMLPLAGLAEVPYLTSTTILDLDRVPDHLLIIGGGYIAIEFGQMFRRFGSRVTIIQRGRTLLSREDEDVARAVAEVLREDGVDLLLEASASAAWQGPEGDVELRLSTPEGPRILAGSHLLLAVGRTPNTESLGLDAAGLSTDENGFLPVDDRLMTRVQGVYALGDVNGGPAFTHVAYDDYRVIRRNLLEGGGGTTRDRLVPYVIYTDPQLGRVGITEREALLGGLATRKFTMPMNYVGRALEVDEPRGFVKVLADNETGRILGCAVLGMEGGEIMSLIQLAMMGGLTTTQLRDTVFAHPALAESLNNLFAP